MFKNLKSIFNKEIGSKKTENISESVISLHNQALAELRILGPIANTLDNSQFVDPDFTFYLGLKSKFNSDYKTLRNSAELLRISIQTKDSFLKIEQTELRYRSSKQQEYYDFIFQLLADYFQEDDKNDLEAGNLQGNKIQNKYSPEQFKTTIREKLEAIIPTVKSQEGQQALADYTDSLEILAAEQELGLKLLYLFKKFQLTDFSIIKVTSDMVNYLQDKSLRQKNAMLDLVEKNIEVFNQLGKIIGLSKLQSNNETYAILLQYICLSKKHQIPYTQFMRLTEILKEWKRFYTTVNNIREEYPANKFNIPDDFKKDISGLEVYKKYQYQLG